MLQILNRNISLKLRKRAIFTLIVLFAAAIIAFAAYSLLHPGVTGVKYEYKIKQLSSKEKVIRVDLSAKNITKGKKIQLLVQGSNSFDLSCTDNNSNKIPFENKDGIIEVGSENSKIINFSYSVRLGNAEKHGHAGESYADMLTFSGDQVLILPLYAISVDDEEIKKEIGSIKVSCDIPKEWTAIVPFLSKEGGRAITKVTHPSFNTIYNLRKSSFTLGKFDKYSFKKDKGVFEIYMDVLSGIKLNDQTKEGLNNLYDYYASLFGYDLPKFSVVLLRGDPEDKLYILGGADSQILSTTFDASNKRDWELMGHRFFHAFFDGKMTSYIFHAPPNLWLYEGLATYYENTSMGALPKNLKDKLGINIEESFSALFKRYAYMSLKDPYTLSFPPMEEDKVGLSAAKTEFLHYTQAPLIVKAIEDRSNQLYGEHNRMLKFIIDYYSDNKLELSSVVHYALGDETNAFGQKYLFGKELLPLWQQTVGASENPEYVVDGLSEMEYILWTWFRQENVNYPIDIPEIAGMEKLSALAEQSNVHFASEDVQSKVKALSPTVYRLLMQYALRAKVCGVDFNDPELRSKLSNDKNNIEIWNDFRK